MASDPVTGKQGLRTIIDLIRHGGLHTMVAVQLFDGTTIHATDRHPFWVESRRQWVDAIDLRLGDEVLTSDGQRAAVARVDLRVEDLIAYNLTVRGLHTYCVGDNPVLVHNAGCDEWAASFIKKMGGEKKTFVNPKGPFLGGVHHPHPSGACGCGPRAATTGLFGGKVDDLRVAAPHA